MKSNIQRKILSLFFLFGTLLGLQAQSIRTNAPLWLLGSPNIGFELTLTRQLTISDDVLW